MLLEDDKTTSTVDTDIKSESPYVVDFAQQNDGTEPTLDDATKIVIDLLDSAKKRQLFNDTGKGNFLQNLVFILTNYLFPLSKISMCITTRLVM